MLFAGIYQELLRGDYRSLFLQWLNALAWAEDDVPADLPLPLDLFPPGLGALTAPQRGLMDFFGIDPDWVEAAAEFSTEATEIDYEAFVADLPVAEKDAFILGTLRGEPGVEAALLKSLRETSAPLARPGEVVFSDLLAEVSRAGERRADADARAREAERLEALRVTARNRVRIYKEIDKRLETKSGASYQLITERIGELAALAAHEGETAAFSSWLRDFRERSAAGRPALLRRLDEAGL